MFITSRLNPGELLAHFLDLHGVKDTSAFKKHRHNRDLCPKFRENVDALLSTYASYRADTYDTQGFSDQGVDVLLRYQTADGEAERSALQLKSYDEFVDWAKAERGSGGSLIEKLGAQHSRAIRHAGINDYYIVLCTDAAEHLNQIRAICAEFTELPSIKVIIPEKALPFFEMSELEIRIAVTRLLCADDPLLKGASAELHKAPPPCRYMLVNVVCRAFEQGPAVAADDLVATYYDAIEQGYASKHGHISDEGEAVNWLEDRGFISCDDNGETYRIEVTNLPVSLCALYFDTRHRQGRGELAEFLIQMLDD